MDKIRNGNLSSSNIFNILGIAKRLMTENELKDYKQKNPKSKATLIEDNTMLSQTAINYIFKKIKERKCLRCLDNEVFSKSINWGSFLEKFIKDKNVLFSDYFFSLDKTKEHNTIKGYVGTKDGNNIKTGATVELKCPYTLDSFTDFAELYLIYCEKKISVKELFINGYTYNNGIEVSHTDGKKYYWQTVSNCLIENTNKGEIIIFMPNEKQLNEIVEYASLIDEADVDRYYNIAFAKNNELPYLPKASVYSNVLKFEFNITKEDKIFLETKIKKALELINNHTK